MEDAEPMPLVVIRCPMHATASSTRTLVGEMKLLGFGKEEKKSIRFNRTETKNRERCVRERERDVDGEVGDV